MGLCLPFLDSVELADVTAFKGGWVLANFDLKKRYPNLEGFNWRSRGPLAGLGIQYIAQWIRHGGSSSEDH